MNAEVQISWESHKVDNTGTEAERNAKPCCCTEVAVPCWQSRLSCQRRTWTLNRARFDCSGLPKAVNISNGKAWSGAQVMGFCRLTPDDVVYTALPLYHSAASLIGFCGVLQHGQCLRFMLFFHRSNFRIRPKFVFLRTARLRCVFHMLRSKLPMLRVLACFFCVSCSVRLSGIIGVAKGEPKGLP